MACGGIVEPVGRIKDIAMRSAGLVSLAMAVLVTVGGAVALATLIGQYGLFGWFVFLIFMGCWLMFAVPFVVTASALHKAASPRHRQAKAKRSADQARRYGLASARSVGPDDPQGPGPRLPGDQGPPRRVDDDAADGPAGGPRRTNDT